MKLIYSCFLFTFLTISAFSQERDSTKITPHHPGRLQIETGVFGSTALGDTFISDAYKMKVGFEVGMDVFLNPQWLLGFRMDLMNTEIEKPKNIGNYKSTYITTIGVNGGYVYSFSNALDLSLVGGIGYASYNNESNFATRFHDNALALWFQPKLGYRITNNIGIYGNVKLRNDFLSIETSPDLEDYFNNASFLNFGIGIRISTN